MDTGLIVNGVVVGIVIFVLFYAGWYAWNNFGLKNSYYSVFSGKKRRLIKHEIRTHGIDKLQGDAKIEAYLRNPIISNAIPELITQAELEIEREKPLLEVKAFIRDFLLKSEFPDSPIVFEQIKISLLKQGYKESFIKGVIKQIQKETKNGAKQIWGKPSPSVPRELPRSPGNIDSGANLGELAKSGNIPIGTLETLGATQRLDDRASPSPKRKSKYFD